LGEDDEPAGGDRRVGEDREMIRGGGIGKEAAGNVDWLIGVIVELDIIHEGQVGVGQEFVDYDVMQSGDTGCIVPPGRSAERRTDRPRFRIFLAVGCPREDE
jgi:hypothetical protein